MNNAIARNKAIYDLLSKYKGDENKINGLSYGFVDDSLKDEFDELYDKYLEETKGQVDSDYDKSLFSSWFYTEPKKIVGAEKLGTGFINPIITVGKGEELDDFIPFKIKENTTFKSESKPKAKKEIKKEVPIENTHSIINKLVSFEKKITNKDSVEPKQEEPTLLSVEDSLKIYSPNIPDAEIKGYVYYKQKFGSPMYGWEKYFLPVHNERTTLCYANKSFSLKDQQFKDVKNVPSGSVLGVKTRFKNEYDGETFWVIKTENKELFYASELNFVEEKTFASVDQEELIKLVKEKGLCYDGNDYVPIFMYTYGDLYEIRQKLRGTYNKENDTYEGGYYNYLVDTFGVDVAKWHEEIIENKIKSKYNFDFSNAIISERPYLSKENEISHTFKIKELNPDSGVSFKRHYDDLDSGKRNKVYWDENVNSVTLFQGYEIWFGSSVTENMLEKTTISDIKNLYFKNGNVYLSEESQQKSKKDQDKEKDERRILAKIEGDKFYGEFLSSALVTNDLLALNEVFNRTFNNFCGYDLDKVPVGFEANSAIFNQKNFLLKPVQRKGMAFLNINNTGCLAYDVGFGKGHLLTSDILTPNGYVKMGDIKVGSFVVGKNGKGTQVIGVYPLGNVQCYKVTFSDGSFTEVSDEHLWNVQTINYRSKYPEKWDTVLTKDIKDNLFNSRGDHQYSIPMVDAVDFDAREIKVNPYLLGALIGDGGLSYPKAISFSNSEEDVISKVKLALPEKIELKRKQNSKCDFSISRKELKDKNELISNLLELGLMGTKSNSKFIPEVYKFNTKEIRLEVLRGLLDTDGYLQVSNKTTSCIVQYTTVSEKLCEDVKFLCQSLGGTVKINTRIPTYTYKGEKKKGQLAYTLTLQLPKGIVPVSSEKHLGKFLERSKYEPIRYISKIEDIGFNEAQCIKVDAEDHLYVCEEFIVTHNTLTAIHNLAMNLKQGTIKRPLIAVPKQVYKNWIYEMFGYWTNGSERDVNKFEDSYFVNGALTGTKYKLNSWFNLGAGKEVENKLVDEYTITLVTYQGLEAIGFSDKLHEEMASDFFQILNVDEEKMTERNLEKEKEKNESLVGKALAKTKYDIDVLGFDYLVFDEAHAFKNIFSSIKIPEEFRDTWRIGKGSQSSRALKAFTLSLYIQKKYGGNVNILTATPFTNSPMELYSMLSLVGYNYLVSSNINNLFKFMSMFIETTVEYTVDHLQNIVLNTVIKSFKNKNILRDILYRYFDYQDNPLDAGVKRPCKIDLPNRKTSTYLVMSDKQRQAQELVVEEANSYDPTNNRGAMGRALSWAKSNAFSPFLIPNIEKYEDLEELVDESPKIKYTIECIKTVKDWHESKGQNCSGQVIYSNRGKDLFPDFKKALEKQCGFVKVVKFGGDIVDEVEIITSSNSEADADRKELIKDAFNEGFVKVIIGTSTIQEGINLQKRGTVLYNLDLDWNPTGAKQLSGRIHRQGNMFKYVRIAVPLVQDTLDSFINQKLDEKSKRIASIWDKENKVNDYSVNDALDPMEIKYNLIKDENKLFSMRLSMSLEKTKKEISIAEEKNNGFQLLKESSENFTYYKQKMLPEFQKSYDNYVNYLSLLNKYVSELEPEIAENNKQGINNLKVKIEQVIAMYEDFSNNGYWKSLFDFKRAIEARKFVETIKFDKEYNNFEISYVSLKRKYEYVSGYPSLNQFSSWTWSSFIESYGNSKRLEKNLLKPYGLTIEDDFSKIGLEYKDNYEKAKYTLDYMNGEEYKAILLMEIREELEKRQQGVGDLFERVDGFSSTNYLLSYPFDDSDSENCEIPTEENEKSEKYLKQELKVDEYLDIEDVSVKVAKQKLSKIKDFLNRGEYLVISENVEEFSEIISDVYKSIKDVPEINATEEIENKIAYLHYFSSNSDWYVMELQKGDIFDDDSEIQKEAFVYAILNGDLENAEYGYSSLEEIKLHAELDLHFKPKELNEILKAKNPKNQKNEILKENDEIKEAIEVLNILSETAEGKEKEEIDEALEVLQMLAESSEFEDGGSVYQFNGNVETSDSNYFGNTTIETPLDVLT